MKELKKLSNESIELLEFIVENQLNGFDDSRWAYCEHNNQGSKPWTTQTVQEVYESGLIEYNGDSDLAWLEYDHEFNATDFISGVEFLSVKEEYFVPLVTYFELNSEE